MIDAGGHGVDILTSSPGAGVHAPAPSDSPPLHQIARPCRAGKATALKTLLDSRRTFAALVAQTRHNSCRNRLYSGGRLSNTANMCCAQIAGF